MAVTWASFGDCRRYATADAASDTFCFGHLILMHHMRDGLALMAFTMVAAISNVSATGDIALPKLFSDHMVLQQKQAMRIRGTADAGERLTIRFAGRDVDTVADPDGNWSAVIQTGPAGGPHQLEIASRDSTTSVVFQDVLVGEVWICGGQSNMQWPVAKSARADAAVEQAQDFPDIRVFNVKPDASTETRDDFEMVNPWYCCSPESIKDFSAVAYYFGRELNRKLGVPIGLINVSRHGSTLEAWTPYDALERDGRFDKLLSHWRERNEPSNPNRVSNAFNAMAAPLSGFAFRGIVWYQGEANVGRGAQYQRMFPLMIESWRNQLGQKNCPFYFVQLTPYRYTERPVEALPEVWDAQLKTFKQVPQTGMVVTTDIGDDRNPHPSDKLTVANRLSRWALTDCYAQPQSSRRQSGNGPSLVEAGAGAKSTDSRISTAMLCGPIYDSHRIDGDRIVVDFRFAGEALQINEPVGNAFTICGPDRKFVPATATIDGTSLIVSHPQISQPIAVRYGWQDTARPVLKNDGGMPASPFRTDDFPLLSEGIEF